MYHFTCAMLASTGICRSCVSACPSQVNVLLKQLNIGSYKQCHTIARDSYFSDAEDFIKTQMGHPLKEAPNADGVG